MNFWSISVALQSKVQCSYVPLDGQRSPPAKTLGRGRAEGVGKSIAALNGSDQSVGLGAQHRWVHRLSWHGCLKTGSRAGEASKRSPDSAERETEAFADDL